jgi:hypothetical protein
MTLLVGNNGASLTADMDVRQFFSFPNPVNETSARLVAFGVVVQAVAFLVLREGWFLVPLVYGFVARVLTGPSASPLGQVAVRIATPFIESRFGVVSRQVPGPPKRFAQLIGLGFSGSAALLWLGGVSWLAVALLAVLVVAASLEAFAAICLGCIAYSALWGCDDCDDISERLQQAVVRARQSVPAEGSDGEVVTARLTTR